ncbi:ARM repeat-containing protein [Cylindrobasidium torrendii FP15055 ss-10]|uniref:ARM repeat-containing protein n=1 Tax=Cylindrobasidium torrendii FP15055 ss-10 TaxID=1314674 RepID=A0A0D7BWR8_9AGAR|nr:ARM repeat-containing protein [Cylindrobasidium torrendii FP15055 ss-10]
MCSRWRDACGLENGWHSLGKNSFQQTMDVFALLVKVSGTDAENVGSALLKQSGDDLRENVARWLAHEVTRIVGRSSAPTDRYALLGWCCTYYASTNDARMFAGIGKLMDATGREGFRRVKKLLRATKAEAGAIFSSGSIFLISAWLQSNQLPEEKKSDVINAYTALLSRTVDERTLDGLDAVTKALSVADIWPAAEKAVNKTPQTALPILSRFFRHHPDPKAVKTAISAARSANEAVRASAVALYSSLSQETLALTSPELTSALKTATADHRLALLAMAARLPPTKGIAVAALGKGDVPVFLAPHIVFALENGEAKEVIKPMEDGLKSPKFRRSYYNLVGEVLWTYTGKDVKTLEMEMEKVLKGGGFEGCVAAAVLLRRLAEPKKNALLVKPLLLREHNKLVAQEEEQWLLRGIAEFVKVFRKDVLATDVLRHQVGNALVSVGVRKGDRRPALEAITACRFPAIVREALTRWTIKEGEESSLAKVLIAAFSDSSEEPKTDKKRERDEDEVINALVLAHRLGGQTTWIDLCRHAKVDPAGVVDKRGTIAVEMICASEDAEASRAAASTLAFVNPAVGVPLLLNQAKADFVPGAKITDEELGIWATEPGKLYGDIAANPRPVKAKGKDAELERWEAEVRKNKTQAAVLEKQLSAEAIVRAKVVAVQKQMQRGLRLVQSIILASTTGLDVLGGAGEGINVSSIAELLLDVASHRLVGQMAADIYCELSRVCESRLGAFAHLVAIATLRSFKGDGIVADQWRQEEVGDLVTRCLFRLHFLAEKRPFDPATFSFIFPFLKYVLLKVPQTTNEDEEKAENEAGELAMHILRFHCPSFADTAYPRLETLSMLLAEGSESPQLTPLKTKDVIIDLAAAIAGNVTRAEVDVLFNGSLQGDATGRGSCLRGLQFFDLTDIDFVPSLWIACHDTNEQNASIALQVWEDNGMDVAEVLDDSMVEYLSHRTAYVRTASAAAIADGWPTQSTVDRLMSFYEEKAKGLAPEYDDYGMVIVESLGRTDPWEARVAVARALELLAEDVYDAEHVSDDALSKLFRFLIQSGALGDKSGGVRRGMLDASVKVLEVCGAEAGVKLLKVFEEYLGVADVDAPRKEAAAKKANDRHGDSEGQATEEAERADHTKEAVVVLLGRVATYLPSNDPRIPGVVSRLTDALKTPSEAVQIAVAGCLAGIVGGMKGSSSLTELVDSLFTQLTEAPKYAERRGAAYGIAGIIKGVGIGGMRTYRVISRIQNANGTWQAKEGAMFLVETLATILGRLFEPYTAPFVLPLLLQGFGDASNDVRDAAGDAAKAVMAELSPYGIKLIFPGLLEGLEEKAWRTKKGSAELLGMMAYSRSVQLEVVIPQLTGVLGDSHAQVRSAANKSLKMFGDVIGNPEVKKLVPVLLKALADPGKTAGALKGVLNTTFVHYIDRSSLAIMIPIIERGLRDRGSEGKRRAVRIVGNLAGLTDSGDFVPYLKFLMPLVRVVLVDPVPEARATAAKALGTLVERLGESTFPELISDLMRVLRGDDGVAGGVDRQGAAQGLSEVLAGLGMERLEGLLPDILINVRAPKAGVREGFMSLLVFLPATFGSRFSVHLPKIVSPILAGMRDVEETVREAAMRAGRMMVNSYANKAVELLLPELENGLFDGGWKIRQASITLIGELLFKISGISSKDPDALEEDSADANTSNTLTDALGVKRKARLLAELYMVRQDGVAAVRHSAVGIWKAIVSNTPKTVREILPELVIIIIGLRGGDDEELEDTASRTVAELVRKFGERIIGEIMNVLKQTMESGTAKERQGVCLVLSDVMENATDSQREPHEDEIIGLVRNALVDDDGGVRAAAAKVGTKGADDALVTALEKESSEAVRALQEIIGVRPAAVFPMVLPTLTKRPLSVFNARALSVLVPVADVAFGRRVNVVLNALVEAHEAVRSGSGPEGMEDILPEAIEQSMATLSEADGVNTTMMLILQWAKSDSAARRQSAYEFFAVFCQSANEDAQDEASLFRIDWMRQLVGALEDPGKGVAAAAALSMTSFFKSIDKDEWDPLSVPLRRGLEGLGEVASTTLSVDGGKGGCLGAMVQVLIAGLTGGSYEQKESAAASIGELVRLCAGDGTPAAPIKPHVVPLTGPLIRVAGTPLPPAVKAAIMQTLGGMVDKISALVKPFFPQLQRTFVKGVSDSGGPTVRSRAAKSLGILMRHVPRIDPVITELVTLVENDGGQYAVDAITEVVENAPTTVGDASKEKIINVVSDIFRSPGSDEGLAQSVANLIAVMASVWSADLLSPIVDSFLAYGTPASLISSRTILACLDPDVSLEPAKLFYALGGDVFRSVAQKTLESATSDRPVIARPAREAREILKSLAQSSPELDGLF